MATTYESYSQKTRSEKLVMCWIEPSERLLIWTLDSGAIYKRLVTRFVVDILEGATSLTEAASAVLTSGQWFYNSETGYVYIRTSDDSNPNTKNVVATSRLFYSNSPLDLPYDLSTGADVHYEGALLSNSPITKELDDEQTGVALESNTNITFNNQSGIFDDIYDTIFFENKRVRIYSWNENILLSEKKLLFDGTIQDKSFSTSKVTFKCKDFMFKLREPVVLPLFSTSDGDLTESVLNTPKRRLYGQADNMKAVAVDAILDGYTLTGTISTTNESTALVGVSTLFLDECSPGDSINVTTVDDVISLTIESITDNTNIVLSSEAENTFLAVTVTNSPVRPWRKKNRNWHITGHKLRTPTTTVSSAAQLNRITVADGSDIFDNDTISVAGENVLIKRIVGNEIVLKSNLQGGIPSVSDPVIKNPLSKAYFKNNEIVIDRDWTVTNSTEAILNLTNTAEFNISKALTIAGTITFANGSRAVTATGTDLRIEVQPRDWIKSSDITHTTYYEILSVSELSLELRIAYAGANNAGTTSQKKNIDLIDESSLITVNCIGMEASGLWVKTASDAVNNLLSVDAGLANINAASFTQSDLDAPYILSMIIPENIGGTIPKIRDVITRINGSVFGSLVNNSDWDLVYGILIPDKPVGLTAIEDDDIIGDISVRTSNKVVRKINLKYGPAVDRFTGENSFKLYEFTNDFVDNYIGAKEEKDVTAFLYDSDNAQEIAERYGLFSSLSQSVITLKGKLNFMLNNLNDKVYLNLDRIYKRFGGLDRRKIGIISKITKDGNSTSVELSDLANSFNRTMSIADDSDNDFTSATSDEKIVNAYVLDDDLEVPDITDDGFLGTSIIG